VGDFETPQRTFSLNALGEGQGGGLKTEEYTIEGGELRRVNGEKAAEGCDLSFTGGVWVNADGPEAAVFLDRGPELLRNPRQAAAKERRACETVG